MNASILRDIVQSIVRVNTPQSRGITDTKAPTAVARVPDPPVSKPKPLKASQLGRDVLGQGCGKKKGKGCGKKGSGMHSIGNKVWICPYHDFTIEDVQKAREHWTPDNHRMQVRALNTALPDLGTLNSFFKNTGSLLWFPDAKHKKEATGIISAELEKILAMKKPEEEKGEPEPPTIDLTRSVSETKTKPRKRRALSMDDSGKPVVVAPRAPQSKFKLTKLMFTTIMGNPKDEWKQVLKAFFNEMAITQYEQLPPAFIEEFNQLICGKEKNQIPNLLPPLTDKYRQEIGRLKVKSEIPSSIVKLKGKPGRPPSKKQVVKKVKVKVPIKKVRIVKPKKAPGKRTKAKVVKVKPHPFIPVGTGVELEL